MEGNLRLFRSSLVCALDSPYSTHDAIRLPNKTAFPSYFIYSFCVGVDPPYLRSVHPGPLGPPCLQSEGVGALEAWGLGVRGFGTFFLWQPKNNEQRSCLGFDDCGQLAVVHFQRCFFKIWAPASNLQQPRVCGFEHHPAGRKRTLTRLKGDVEVTRKGNLEALRWGRGLIVEKQAVRCSGLGSHRKMFIVLEATRLQQQ